MVIVGFLCTVVPENPLLQNSVANAADASRKADSSQPMLSFVRQNCLDCHDGSDGEGGFDASTLTSDLQSPGMMQKWVRIHDRVRNGEMPPPDSEPLSEKQITQFTSVASSWLRSTQQQLNETLGRSRGRRLTNVQLERTLGDLLAVNVPVAKLLPGEQRSEGFYNIADVQSMSHFHLQSHLQAVDTVLDAAFDRLSGDHRLLDLDLDTRGVARRNPRQRCRDPEMLDGKAVVWSSGLIFYGRISASRVPESGWYRITLAASAINKPDDRGVWCSVRSGACVSSAPLMYWIGALETTEKTQQWTFDAWIEKNHVIEVRPADLTLKQARFQGGQVGAGEGTPQKVPGVAIDSMTVQRIFPGGEIDEVREHLIGTMKTRLDRKSRGLVLMSSDGKSAPEADELVAQLKHFMRRAFRHPVADDVAAPYIEMLQSELADGESPLDALRHSYRAVLCSPRFLYHYESPGPLDDHAIACRLSYLITGSMPDTELQAAADAGRLSDPGELNRQLQRLLDSDACDQFVRDFAGQWLDLVDIEFTEPDRRMYPEFDTVVQDAMLSETHLFLKTLIQQDAPAADLVDAPFTFLNSRLARYYRVDGVSGDEMRQVQLEPTSHRGGLLSHGSILKVTANGTNTSPVLRGVWLCNRLLGRPIPPPPENVPAIEPDVRGAKTIREILAKHRDHADCAVCHQNIDPPGFALENFDAAGQWRDDYLQFNGRRSKVLAPVDPSYTLPDGTPFDSFENFREIIASQPQPLARNFAEKLLVYATGASIGFADRPVVDEIVRQSESAEYGLRSLIQAVVTSPIFLSK
ncbi:hypothetical protein Pla52n_45540 [Stieleria varia]|uniref:Planctomycete cytochrome C n=2 Tax=Stieleria varia TaxID=2528005 RepID=A0A5C6AQC2_9BACT|nr:hypothetical protein Pla52n_45540 [Stieleria varia]